MIEPYSLYKRFPVEFDFTSEDSVIDSDSPSDLRVMSAKSTIVDTNTYTMRQLVRAGYDLYHVDSATEIGCSLLEGCYDDYVFFQGNYSTTDTLYYLLIGDISKGSSGFDLDDCICYCIKCHNLTNDLQYSTYTPSQYIRFPSLVLANGSGSAVQSPYIQESIHIPSVFPQLNTQYSIYQIDINDDILEYNEGYFYYSSFEGFPHLVEGVQNYAVAAFVVCFAVLAFKLADRLFRRVY